MIRNDFIHVYYKKIVMFNYVRKMLNEKVRIPIIEWIFHSETKFLSKKNNFGYSE